MNKKLTVSFEVRTKFQFIFTIKYTPTDLNVARFKRM